MGLLQGGKEKKCGMGLLQGGKEKKIKDISLYCFHSFIEFNHTCTFEKHLTKHYNRDIP